MFLLLGCTQVDRPPSSWPAGGCIAGEDVAAGAEKRDSWLELPDGVQLAVTTRAPSSCGGAVLLIPGGLQVGRELALTQQADVLLDAGLTVVAFDPRGRGESEGVEDANGSIAQDDLAALSRWVAARPQVDPAAVVIFSRSFGAAMAAGALARHDDLAPLAWLDYEGPCAVSADLDYTDGRGVDAILALVDAADDPEAWWLQREPAGFISSITVPYWRVQGLPDHALGGRIEHALQCINGATAAPEVVFNRFSVALPSSEEQLMGWAIEGGLEPDEDYVTQTLLTVLE